MTFVKNPAYWGKDLNVKKGLITSARLQSSIFAKGRHNSRPSRKASSTSIRKAIQSNGKRPMTFRPLPMAGWSKKHS